LIRAEADMFFGGVARKRRNREVRARSRSAADRQTDCDL